MIRILMEQIGPTTALSVTTLRGSIGDYNITSLVYNPHDDSLYGCEANSASIIKIKGTFDIIITCFPFYFILF